MLKFRSFELRNNYYYKHILNSVVSVFIDSGADLAVPMASIEQRKQVYICIANYMGVVCNERMNHLCVHRCLLTNRLHGKVAEQCLANN